MSSRREYFYRSKPIEKHKMTLIIGLKFKDGVILVADRKATDTSTGKHSHELKLKVPLNIPLVFSAAGFSHKFKQFNRKILEKIDERIREINLANVSYYNQLGLPFKEIETKKAKPKKLNTKDIEKEEGKQVEETKNLIPKEVYVYSIERFIEDCQSLIRQLCTGIDDIIRPDLDVLLTLYSKDGARLHHINYLGEEDEVNYCAIGSGADYINLFLSKFWDEEMTIEQILRLAYFCIYYVQDLDLDSGVGMELDKLPDHLVITHDGTLGEWSELEQKKDAIISDTKENVNKFKELISSLSF